MFKNSVKIVHVLTKSLVDQALQWDMKDNIAKAPKDTCSKHLDDLVNAINECGVSFHVWAKKDANGKESGIYDFTSLMGSDKKLLIRHLPEKLKNCINPHCSESVIKLWKVKLK